MRHASHNHGLNNAPFARCTRLQPRLRLVSCVAHRLVEHRCCRCPVAGRLAVRQKHHRPNGRARRRNCGGCCCKRNIILSPAATVACGNQLRTGHLIACRQLNNLIKHSKLHILVRKASLRGLASNVKHSRRHSIGHCRNRPCRRKLFPSRTLENRPSRISRNEAAHAAARIGNHKQSALHAGRQVVGGGAKHCVKLRHDNVWPVNHHRGFLNFRCNGRSGCCCSRWCRWCC